MSINKAKKEDDEDDKEGSGTGGKGGEGVEFRLKTEASRDDMLSGEEKRNYVSRHAIAHLEAVKKQKSAIDERKLVKNGEVSVKAHREGKGLGGYSENGCRAHPELQDKVQFHVAEKKVTMDAAESEPNTNDELQNKLQQRFELTNRPQNVPRFNPQPIKR